MIWRREIPYCHTNETNLAIAAGIILAEGRVIGLGKVVFWVTLPKGRIVWSLVKLAVN